MVRVPKRGFETGCRPGWSDPPPRTAICRNYAPVIIFPHGSAEESCLDGYLIVEMDCSRRPFV